MRKILSVIFILFTISSFSQKHFRKGYILQQGDTIHGMVQYREGNASLDKCTFQKNGQAETTYASNNLDGYGFEGRHFRSIKNDGSVLFAEVIVDGKAKLLRQGALFLVQKDTVAVPLSSVTEQTTIEGRQYTKEDKTYALRLRAIFSDCPSLPPSYEKMELWTLTPSEVEKRFSAIVSKYNDCFGTTSTKYEVPKSKPSLTWGAEIGAMSPNYSADTQDRKLNSTELNSSIGFTGGLFLDYTYPRISEKLHLRVGVNYLQTKFTGTYISQYPDSENTINIHFTAIKIPVSLAYNFSTSNFSPYLRGGANVQFLSDQEFSRTRHYLTSNPISDQKQELLEMSNSVINFFAGVGAEFKVSQKHSLFAEFRYESKVDVLAGYIGLSAGIRF